MAVRQRGWKKFFGFYLPLLGFTVFTLFPFYWMFITSIKPDQHLYNLRISPFWTTRPTLEHYQFLFQRTLFGHWLLNTLLVAVVSTAISLFCGILAGYALARLRFRWAGTLGTAIFITYLVPQTLLFIPLTGVVDFFHLLDTPWALIFTYPTFLIPFCTWLLMGYFKAIPRELEEYARIDGATRLQAMRKIVLPVAIPGILSAGIFAFTLSWNEFLYALVFLSSPQTKTIPVGVVSELMRGDVLFWGPLMAGALLGSVPVALIYSFFVEHYVAGLTGAVKG
ncbi:MAG: sugar ABC transporter permease [Candidatus Tectimicrobiota bacterium]|nr:MAG: sugar ABC transporter permease [Candidatus Tectomicrobia bacterium]